MPGPLVDIFARFSVPGIADRGPFALDRDQLNKVQGPRRADLIALYRGKGTRSGKFNYA